MYHTFKMTYIAINEHQSESDPALSLQYIWFKLKEIRLKKRIKKTRYLNNYYTKMLLYIKSIGSKMDLV